MAQCPHCKRDVPDDAVVCPYCGSQLRPDLVVCGNCGSVIPADAKICPYCGAELTEKAICPNCGREIPPNALSCPHCGFVFDKNEENTVLSENMKTQDSIAPISNNGPKRNFWKAFAAGFVVAMLITTAFLSIAVIIPLNSEVRDLNHQLEMLHSKYEKLSLKYNYTVLNYTRISREYIQEVHSYNALLANYTSLFNDYKNITSYEDEKFIVLLFFTTDYGRNKYWLYLEIDPNLYLYYKQLSHYSGTYQNINHFKNYVVVDAVMKTIVNSVKEKLSTNSDEELADSLLSLVQNKIGYGSNGEIYGNLTNVPGTYYYVDTPAKYPVETLVLRSGECLDDSILYLSLIKASGLSGGFAFYDLGSEGHAQPWVNLTTGHPEHTHDGSYSYFQYNGKWYYPAESTAYGWRVGEQPEQFKGHSFYFLPTS